MQVLVRASKVWAIVAYILSVGNLISANSTGGAARVVPIPVSSLIFLFASSMTLYPYYQIIPYLWKFYQQKIPDYKILPRKVGIVIFFITTIYDCFCYSFIDIITTIKPLRYIYKNLSRKKFLVEILPVKKFRWKNYRWKFLCSQFLVGAVHPHGFLYVAGINRLNIFNRCIDKI